MSRPISRASVNKIVATAAVASIFWLIFLAIAWELRVIRSFSSSGMLTTPHWNNHGTVYLPTDGHCPPKVWIALITFVVISKYPCIACAVEPQVVHCCCAKTGAKESAYRAISTINQRWYIFCIQNKVYKRVLSIHF